jgi:hypothetical protein
MDPATMAEFTTRIKAAWHTTSMADRAQGRAWYATAHDLAEIIGHGDVNAGAGIIAALSPRMPWQRNVKLAMLAADGEFTGTLKANLAKAERIYLGEDPRMVLPADSKTHNFYRNILDPFDPDPVTVDQWAWRVASGENGVASISKNQYAFAATAYRLAALDLGELPCVVQAVTWLWIRRINGTN